MMFGGFAAPGPWRRRKPRSAAALPRSASSHTHRAEDGIGEAEARAIVRRLPARMGGVSGRGETAVARPARLPYAGHGAREASGMPKGYWVVSVDVSDPEGYKLYIAENAKAFRKYGARFLARGGKAEAVEGKGRARIVVIEFRDYETALACYRSPEYAKAIDIRKGKAVADIVVTEGYDGPQPTNA